MSTRARVVIVTEHASARFGGEAALPLHYFRVLRARGVPVWLITHARTQEELSALYPGDPSIIYIADTAWHKAMWAIGRHLPDQISYFTTGFLSRLATQFTQRRLVARLVLDQRLTVIHQPAPVSPKEPSMLFGLGAPVVIGPMNGGMDYPPAFRQKRGATERLLLAVGRANAAALNLLMPGKRRAHTLMVANRRTREALPHGVSRNVVDLVENGVDLRLWHGRATTSSAAAVESSPPVVTTFAFMGRLVDWKAVDLLIEAFATASVSSPMRLWILGDGVERDHLESQAQALGLLSSDDTAHGKISFAGWLAQADCAQRLEQVDSLVLPSLLECGGAVVLEAMSMGKPVIATAWGGPLDYLDSSCGILVQPTSKQALIDGFAAAMVDLARSPARRRSMGKNAMRRVELEFDWESKVDRVMAIYESAMPSA